MRIVDKIKQNMLEFQELYEQGVYGYISNLFNSKYCIHISKELFIQLVNELPVQDSFEIVERDTEDFPYELSFRIEGIEYFMIFDENEYDEMVELVSEWNDELIHWESGMS